MHKKLNPLDGGDGSACSGEDGAACACTDDSPANDGSACADVVSFLRERVSIGVVRRRWVNM